MESVEIVNSMKLTKTEKKALIVLLTPREEEECFAYPTAGNDSAGIALQVWGEEAKSLYWGQGDILSSSAKTRVSRTLNSLWRKGLVFRGHPKYQYGCFDHPCEDRPTPFHFRDLVLIVMCDYSGRIASEITHSGRWHVRLPKNTKVWWMLTDEGTKIAEEIAGITPRRERCSQCFHGLDKNDECKHQVGRDYRRAVENPLEIDECEYFKDKDRWKRNEWTGELQLLREDP